jgi:hypothetical protein
MTAKAQTPVLIATPMRRYRGPEDIPAETKRLMNDLAAIPDLPWSFDFATFAGGNVARGRNKIIASLLRGPWKWIIFKDDDIPAEPKDIIALLSRRLHVCGVLYTTRDELNCHWVLNTFQEAVIDATGLLRVGELGTGCKCYHRSVFETLLKSEPDLAYVDDDSGNPEWGFFCMGVMAVDGRRRWLPEDYWLDQLCRRHKIPVHVDTTIKLRHVDTDGTSYPLDDEWPELPGPKQAAVIEAPPDAGQWLAAVDPRKIILCLQYWEGDRPQAMRLARFIADLEPVFRDDVEFCFVRRHDAEPLDDDTRHYVAVKFRVAEIVSPEHVPGYPASPNLMALDTMRRMADPSVAERAVKACLLMEADCVPVARNWIDELSLEWDRASSHGKSVLGAWLPLCGKLGHINGNLLFSPDLFVRLGMENHPCPPKKPWDIVYPPLFAPVWAMTGLILNLYKEICVPDERFQKPHCGVRPPVLVHGVKDESVWKYAERTTGVKT